MAAVPYYRTVAQYGPDGRFLSTVQQNYTATGPSYFDSKPPVTRTKRVAGWRPPTSYTRQILSESGSWTGNAVHRQKNPDGGSTVITWPMYADTTNSNYGPSWNGAVPTIPWTSLTARAEIECKIKLKAQNVQYCTALAEASKSVQAIASSLTQVFGAYKALRQGNFVGALKSLNILPRPVTKKGSGVGLKEAGKQVWAGTTGPLANRWLELQYGWLPLLGDIASAYEDSRRSFLDRGYVVSAKRVVKYGLRSEKKLSHPNKLVATIKQSGEAGVKVRLDYTLRSDALSIAATTGITNPAEVLWELVPFSFIFDWIVPIGDWLSSLDADFGLLFKGGTKTLFSHLKIAGSCDYQGASSFAGGYWVNASFQRSYVEDYVTRTVYASTPFPMPYFKSPVSTLHAMNALALGRVLLAGSKVPSFVRN